MSKVRVCGEAILVEITPVEKKSAGGIILNTNEKREISSTETGTVVQIGPLAVVHLNNDDDTDRFLKVGEKIEFTRYAGKIVNSEIEDGKQFRIIMPDDIHLVIEE